jgi:hypothetical protein
MKNVPIGPYIYVLVGGSVYRYCTYIYFCDHKSTELSLSFLRHVTVISYLITKLKFALEKIENPLLSTKELR